jgi:hypothetical protein
LRSRRFNQAEAKPRRWCRRRSPSGTSRSSRLGGEAAGFGLQADAYRAAPDLTTFRLQLEAIEEVLPGTRKIVRPGERDVEQSDLWLLEPLGGETR